MAYSNLSRPFPRVERAPLVPHDRFLADRWSGVLHLRWQVSRKHPVVIGSGAFELHQPKSLAQRHAPPVRRRLTPQQAARLRVQEATIQLEPKIVAGIVRRGSKQLVVLPGSSLKGAVRQIYELFTPSCDLIRSGCGVHPDTVRPRVCPACSLFGCRGLGGRVYFGEADPDGPITTSVRAVPAGWDPRKDYPGTLKVYDLNKAVDNNGIPREEKEFTWTASGAFRSPLRLMNVSDKELGILLLALGIAMPTPGLRLGGRKYHGFGVVDVNLQQITWQFPQPAKLDTEQSRQWAMARIRQAATTPECFQAQQQLHAAWS